MTTRPRSASKFARSKIVGWSKAVPGRCLGTAIAHFRLSRLEDSVARTLAESAGLVVKAYIVFGSARYPTPQSVALPKPSRIQFGRARLCRAGGDACFDRKHRALLAAPQSVALPKTVTKQLVGRDSVEPISYA